MRAVYASFDEVPSFKAASTHILANCRELTSRFKVHLLTLGEITLPAAPGFRHSPAALAEGNYLRRGEQFREFVRRRLERERPALLHFRTPWEGLLAGRLRLPNVYEVNGLPSIELPYLYRDAGPRVLATLRDWEQACLENADAIVCPSPRIRECLLRRYRIPDPSRIHVIPNGYDPVQCTPPAYGVDTLRAVYLGTLHPWQGIVWALRAFARLGDRYRLDIYGIGARQWLRHAEKRIHRHGLADRVRLMPALDRTRLSQTLGTYHVGIAPLLKTPRNAEQGCCPVKIMDYLAHGLITVAPDLAVIRPLLEHGRNGFLYPANCLWGLETALADLHQRRGQLPAMRHSVLHSLKGFPTWNECSRRLLTIYENIVEKDSR